MGLRYKQYIKRNIVAARVRMFYTSGIPVLNTEDILSLYLLRLKLPCISYTDSHLKE
jgi:hypothetical protein